MSSDSSLMLRVLNPPQAAGEIGRLAHYRVLKVLGEGGMGIVFLAEDTRLSRTVALKTMKPEIAANPPQRQRFLREARAAARVEHDHIVPIYDIGENNGVPWLAMPLLKGQSLDELLKRVKLLNPAQAVRLGVQVAKGLAAAHAAGLIHRDVKPGNIWVEPEGGGRAKLLDFGLARDDHPDPEEGEHLTRTGAVVGTPAYMAPEQASGEALDARADLFSLGCVLYRMVTGRLPFRGQGMMATLRALATETPPTPHEVNPAVPPPLSALIMNLLAKDRTTRPASASAVAAALQALLDKTASSLPAVYPLAIPVAPQRAASDPTELLELPKPTVSPRRGRRRLAAAAVLLVVVGALTATIVVLLKHKDGKEAAHVTGPEGGAADIKPDGDGRQQKAEPADVSAERRAAEWVLSQGGKVLIEPERLGIRTVADARELPPKRPFRILQIDLQGKREVNDAGLQHLKTLTRLKHLWLTDAQVSDAGLENLKALTKLETLSLQNTPVNGAGLVHLKTLTSLKELYLSGSPVNDAGVAHLKTLTSLKRLGLDSRSVGDAGLAHLKTLTSLKSLSLRDAQVGDAGLENLKTLTKLEYLDLRYTRVGDVGLAHLKAFPSLRTLYLNGTRVSDAGLMHLQTLTNLEGLTLTATDVGDAGLGHLKPLPKLRMLLLDNTLVSDAGLVHLKSLANLKDLHLAQTKVSDAGLEHLKELTGLTSLDLTDSKVTATGAAGLQKALPKCKIIIAAAR